MTCLAALINKKCTNKKSAFNNIHLSNRKGSSSTRGSTPTRINSLPLPATTPTKGATGGDKNPETTGGDDVSLLKEKMGSAGGGGGEKEGVMSKGGWGMMMAIVGIWMCHSSKNWMDFSFIILTCSCHPFHAPIDGMH